MKKGIFLFIFFSAIIEGSCLSAISFNKSLIIYTDSYQPDSVSESQILYNGQLWRNLYARVKKDQFLFTNDFLPGTVTIDDKTFSNINIKYDIFNDELITPLGNGAIIQFNKEMIDGFSFMFQGNQYNFTKIEEDSVRGFNGYLNVLTSGKTTLYVKYKKEIENLAVEDKYDLFFQTHRIFIVKDGLVSQIMGKRGLLNLFEDSKVQIKGFIKKNRLKISKNYPESFIPVVQYYNSLKP